jgi:hypothetical protein
MEDKLTPGPKPRYTPDQIAQAYRLYFVDKIGRIKAGKEMDIEPATVVYLAHLHKKRLAANQ